MIGERTPEAMVVIWAAATVAVIAAAVGALALWDFLVGPWYWRRRFARDAERLAELGRERLP